MAENHHPASNQPPWRRIPGWLPILIITIGFFWKLTLTKQFTWFDHPDMAYLEIPRLGFQARELHEGRFPLWDPHIWAGQPLIGQTQPGPLYPLNLALNLLNLRDGYLRFTYLNWYWALIHFLAAVFLYWFARDLGLSRAAAYLGAVAFGFGGFVGTAAWLDVVNGAIWAPLVFLFLFRSIRGTRPFGNAALGGLFLGVAWLSGHHEIPLLLSATAGLTWMGHLRQSRKLFLPAVLFFTTAFLISAPQTLATQEFGRISKRWVGLDNAVGWEDKIPYTVHHHYSFPARGVLTTVIPSFGSYADSSPYVGWTLVALAAVGVLACWNRALVRWSLIVIVVALIYAFGSFAPLNGIIYATVPILDKARIPSRALSILGFALAILVAYGAHAMLEDRLLPAARRLCRILTVTGLVVLLLIAGFGLAEKGLDDRIGIGAFACLAVAGLLSAWRAGTITRSALASGLLVTSLVELSNGGPAAYSNLTSKTSNAFVRSLTENHDIAAYLRERRNEDGRFRVAIDDQVIGTNFGDWHGIDMLLGYVAGVSNNLLRHELHTKRTQDLFGVRFLVGKKPDREQEQQEVFTGATGVKVYRNPESFPRSWVIHEAKRVADDDYLRIAIQDASLDLRKIGIFLGEAPQLESCGGDHAEVLSHSANAVRLRVRTGCRGMVVLSETNYPGWEVHVNGKQGKLWEPYGVFRGVVVEAGTSDILFRFRPKSVLVGTALLGLGLVLLTAAVISKR